MAESIRASRTSLMLSVSGGPPEAIVVTSPHPGEGKSTISLNLAIALAQDGHRVVILDCDLRRPRLHQVFHLDNVPGLTSFLTGNSSREAILKSTEVDNLFLIPAGPIPPSPAELLNSPDVQESSPGPAAGIQPHHHRHATHFGIRRRQSSCSSGRWSFAGGQTPIHQPGGREVGAAVPVPGKRPDAGHGPQSARQQ